MFPPLTHELPKADEKGSVLQVGFRRLPLTTICLILFGSNCDWQSRKMCVSVYLDPQATQKKGCHPISLGESRSCEGVAKICQVGVSTYGF